MATIDLAGLDKAVVLTALYNAAKPLFMGFMKFDPTPMSMKEARELLNGGHTDFDYLKGRVIKIDLSTDQLKIDFYDKDNGQNAAQQVIDSLRGTNNDPNNVVIRAQHASATRDSAQDTLDHLSDEWVFSHGEGEKLASVEIGLNDVANILKPRIEKALESTKSPLE